MRILLSLVLFFSVNAHAAQKACELIFSRSTYENLALAGIDLEEANRIARSGPEGKQFIKRTAKLVETLNEFPEGLWATVSSVFRVTGHADVTLKAQLSHSLAVLGKNAYSRLTHRVLDTDILAIFGLALPSFSALRKKSPMMDLDTWVKGYVQAYVNGQSAFGERPRLQLFLQVPFLLRESNRWVNENTPAVVYDATEILLLPEESLEKRFDQHDVAVANRLRQYEEGAFEAAILRESTGFAYRQATPAGDHINHFLDAYGFRDEHLRGYVGALLHEMLIRDSVTPPSFKVFVYEALKTRISQEKQNYLIERPAAPTLSNTKPALPSPIVRGTSSSQQVENSKKKIKTRGAQKSDDKVTPVSSQPVIKLDDRDLRRFVNGELGLKDLRPEHVYTAPLRAHPVAEEQKFEIVLSKDAIRDLKELETASVKWQDWLAAALRGGVRSGAGIQKVPPLVLAKTKFKHWIEPGRSGHRLLCHFENGKLRLERFTSLK